MGGPVRHPDMLWFDVPKDDSDHLNAKQLLADYYNRAERRNQAVAVNDRAATDSIGPTMVIEDADEDSPSHGDFVTPEYTSYDEIQDAKWECCRGIGHSSGYNRSEGQDDHLSSAELIRSFVDIVSKNGNPRYCRSLRDIQRLAERSQLLFVDVCDGD